MQILLDADDLRRLSPNARSEVMALLGGAPAGPPARQDRLKWREAYPLNEEEARLLVQGLSSKQKQRLALFASKTGRARMKDIMAAGGDKDLKPSSTFAKDMTRRLRRLIDDPEKKAQLIQWDFESTKWDASKTTIVDGVYYVAPTTAHSLRRALGTSAGDRG